jgi:hypothetical protein
MSAPGYGITRPSHYQNHPGTDQVTDKYESGTG